MPELPEVETVVRGLARRIIGLEISSCRILSPHIRRDADGRMFKELMGQKVLGLNRRGKLIVIRISGGLILLVHLKMTGRLLLVKNNQACDRHTHFLIRFKGDGELRFRDVRKFGFVKCFREEDLDDRPEIRSLGPEPHEVSFPAFREILGDRKGRIKSLLLNQAVLAGIGNIYADEILHRARIHPLTNASRLDQEKLNKLWRATRHILCRAIRYRGSSVRDYRDSGGREGRFQDYHRVYGREGEPCRRCGAGIKRMMVGGRGSYFCPGCQKILGGPAV